MAADVTDTTVVSAGPARGALSYFWLTAAVIGLDQLTKSAIERALQLYRAVDLLPVLQITRLHNTGAAFSFLAEAAGWQRWLFTGLAILVSIVLVAWLRRINPHARMLASAVALILGGALGNLIDRLRWGYVIDFVSAHWQMHYFPAFNAADSAITVGAALLLLDAWLTAR